MMIDEGKHHFYFELLSDMLRKRSKEFWNKYRDYCIE